jgi:2-polyprenyl-3-methyl-5-hydroxy-6-metoxy-1,4-benzoquinol methylase
MQSFHTRKGKAMADTVDISKRDEIAAVKKNAVERLGTWTAHNIYLGDGIHTMDAPQNDARLRRVLQVAADIAGKPLNELRVLDLACLEGQIGIEFAQHGAEVVANEGREANLVDKTQRLSPASLAVGSQFR